MLRMSQIVDGANVKRAQLARLSLSNAADIGRNKADAAARGAQRLRPGQNVVPLAINVVAEKFDGALLDDVDAVFCCVDNVEARLTIDQLCIGRRLVLVDASTIGNKVSVVVAVPHVTDSYV